MICVPCCLPLLFLKRFGLAILRYHKLETGFLSHHLVSKKKHGREMPYRSATGNDSLTISNLNCFVFFCTVFLVLEGSSWQFFKELELAVNPLCTSRCRITAGQSMASLLPLQGSPGCLCQWTRASLLPRGVWHPFDFSSTGWPRRTTVT